MNHKGTQKIESDRIILRQFSLKDAQKAFLNWESDTEVTKYLSWKPMKSIEETKSVIEGWVNSYNQKDFYQWAIELKEIMEPIGSISVVGLDEKTLKVQVGYCIGKSWWRKGYTSEALRLLIPFFFREVGVNRIEARHDPQNPNSGRVLKKCGFTFEGVLRQAVYTNNGISDTCMYSLLAKEYCESNFREIR